MPLPAMSYAVLPHNPTLEASHAAIQSRLKRIRYVGNAEPNKWQAAMREHEIIASLAARDGEALRRGADLAHGTHLERVKDVL